MSQRLPVVPAFEVGSTARNPTGLRLVLLLGVLTLLVATLTPRRGLAQNVPGLFSTGVDETCQILVPGARDPHWELVESPDAGVGTAPGNYT